jgi:hypothetical protein
MAEDITPTQPSTTSLRVNPPPEDKRRDKQKKQQNETENEHDNDEKTNRPPRHGLFDEYV